MHDPNDNSVVLGVLADAFRLRPTDGGALSAAHAEFYGTESHSNQPKAAIEKFKSVMTVKPADRFVVGQVGKIKLACSDFGLKVRIVTDPEPGHPAHASVRQFQDDKHELLELLASEAWSEIVAV